MFLRDLSRLIDGDDARFAAREWRDLADRQVSRICDQGGAKTYIASFS